jgi:hypothetical protein
VIASRDIYYPVGLAADLDTEFLYWTDSMYHTIERCTYDGRRRFTVVNRVGEYQVTELFLVVFEIAFPKRTLAPIYIPGVGVLVCRFVVIFCSFVILLVFSQSYNLCYLFKKSIPSRLWCSCNAHASEHHTVVLLCLLHLPVMPIAQY